VTGQLTEDGKHFVLLGSLVLLFLAYPVLVELGRLSLFRLFFTTQLLLAVYSIGGTRRSLVTALVLGSPAIASQLVTFSVPTKAGILISGASSFVFLGYVIYVVYRSVLRGGRVTGGKIAGAISVYLLLGLLWSILYGLVAVVQPEAFKLPDEITLREAMGIGGEYVFIYFSFVTLTTLGFGEITPAAPLARTLAWLEAVTGQLFIAISIARLVAMQIAHGKRE
jgi:hypothetical protein